VPMRTSKKGDTPVSVPSFADLEIGTRAASA
jgi:hypothetical protein